jgi:hypothetical protein
MSTLEVGKIVPATGTAITLGESGDTLTVPSGGNLTVASGATINITGATQTGFPAAGLAIASQWRLTTDFTGDKAPIDGNLEQVDAPVGFGVLGSSMTESSGIFTFPATGYWLIKFHAYFLANTNSLYNRITIQTTTNNATYAVAAVTSGAAGAANQEQGITTEYIFDVTDTANCKCRFDVDVNAAGVTTKGDTAQNETFMSFIKLGDT